ncbi:hypothetical protein [Actinomadura monticuli]|uniref:Uncharacterized protein n=1 Tax=Actinomadura monticuli TaxID=3097367 RepID=A0ABV4Q512_9ACTN
MEPDSHNSLFGIWLRRPVQSSAFAFLLLLLIVAPSAHLLGAGVSDHGWATALVFVTILTSPALTFFIYRKKVHRIPPAQMMALLWSYGNLPWLVAFFLLLLGAATWSFWVAVIGVGVHLGWMAWVSPVIGAARTESDPTT